MNTTLASVTTQGPRTFQYVRVTTLRGLSKMLEELGEATFRVTMLKEWTFRTTLQLRRSQLKV